MKTIKINKTFSSYQECEEWEDKNFPDRTYNGGNIFMISHTEDAQTGKITIDSVMVV